MPVTCLKNLYYDLVYIQCTCSSKYTHQTCWNKCSTVESRDWWQWGSVHHPPHHGTQWSSRVRPSSPVHKRTTAITSAKTVLIMVYLMVLLERASQTQLQPVNNLLLHALYGNSGIPPGDRPDQTDRSSQVWDIILQNRQECMEIKPLACA